MFAVPAVDDAIGDAAGRQTVRDLAPAEVCNTRAKCAAEALRLAERPSGFA